MTAPSKIGRCGWLARPGARPRARHRAHRRAQRSRRRSNQLLKQTFARPTRDSSPSRRRTDASSACSRRPPARNGHWRSAPPAATARSGSASDAGDRRAADDRSSTTACAPGKPQRTSAAPACRTSSSVIVGRRVQGDSEAAGHVRFRLPRRVEARLQEVLRPGVSRGSAAAGLFLAHNVINKKNEMQDFLERHQDASAGVDYDRLARHEGISVTSRNASNIRRRRAHGSTHSPDRRAPRSRRQSPRHGHGAVGVSHRRHRRAAHRAWAHRRRQGRHRHADPGDEGARRRTQAIRQGHRARLPEAVPVVAGVAATKGRSQSCSAAITAWAPDRSRRRQRSCERAEVARAHLGGRARRHEHARHQRIRQRPRDAAGGAARPGAGRARAHRRR